MDLPADERPLPLRCRPDIVTNVRHSPRGKQWICKDPVRLRYYSLSEVEYSLWRMLDGRTSVAQIQRRFAREFAPRQLNTHQFMAYLGRLFRQELVVSTVSGQGLQLAERAASRRWQHLGSAVFQLFAWRFRGIDPDAWLSRMLPYVRWLFHASSAWLLVALVLLASGVAFTSAPELAASWPRLHEFFRADNLLLLGLTLSIVKILHELGHALTCKYFGGEVRELGVMLFFFSPCLYCDVSDAWLFPQRAQRMWVSAAGILVEICLAAIATLVWRWTQPGLLHHLSLNVMIVCGISTLLVNGNPLMRYDGYYLLADALEIPNLDERARARWRQFLAAILLGIALPNESPEREPRRNLLLLYGLLSTIYRMLLLASVLWMLYSLLQPMRLEVLAIASGVLCLGGILAMPLIETAQQLRNPFFWQRVSLRKVGLRLATIAVLLGGLAMIPLPYRVVGPGVLESAHTQQIYATTPGQLVAARSPGERVLPNETVVQLDNPAARFELAQLTAEAQRLAVRLQTLETLRGIDPDVASEIPTAQETLADVQQQLQRRQVELQQLNLVAKQAGQVIEAPRRERQIPADAGLPSWSDSLLSGFNQGAHVATGTLVAQVVDPTKLEVRLLLDQSNIGLVAVGQRTYVSLWQAPGDVLSGEVMEVSRVHVDEIPQALQAAGDILMHENGDLTSSPLTPQYQVRIALDQLPEHPIFGGRCTARIVVAPQSLAARVLRQLRQVFGQS